MSGREPASAAGERCDDDAVPLRPDREALVLDGNIQLTGVEQVGRALPVEEYDRHAVRVVELAHAFARQQADGAAALEVAVRDGAAPRKVVRRQIGVTTTR